LERDSLFKDGFFSKGVTTVCLKREGNVPVSRERFTIVVMTDASMFTHSLSSEVGIGSRSHYLSGDFRIILIISSRVTEVKLSKTGGMDGGSVCEDECRFALKPSDEWSLDILSVKNEEKQSVSVILAVVVGRAEGGL